MLTRDGGSHMVTIINDRDIPAQVFLSYTGLWDDTASFTEGEWEMWNEGVPFYPQEVENWEK